MPAILLTFAPDTPLDILEPVARPAKVAVDAKLLEREDILAPDNMLADEALDIREPDAKPAKVALDAILLVREDILDPDK